MYLCCQRKQGFPIKLTGQGVYPDPCTHLLEVISELCIPLDLILVAGSKLLQVLAECLQLARDLRASHKGGEE